MAGTIGDAFVNVHLDSKGVESQLDQVGGGLEGRFGKMGGLAGTAMKLGVVGAVAGTALAVGKELYDIGARFDDIATRSRPRPARPARTWTGSSTRPNASQPRCLPRSRTPARRSPGCGNAPA